MGKYQLKDIEKALTYIQKECNDVYVRIEFSELGNMSVWCTDRKGDSVKITIFDEAVQKFPEIAKTQRL